MPVINLTVVQSALIALADQQRNQEIAKAKDIANRAEQRVALVLKAVLAEHGQPAPDQRVMIETNQTGDPVRVTWPDPPANPAPKAVPEIPVPGSKQIVKLPIPQETLRANEADRADQAAQTIQAQD